MRLKRKVSPEHVANSTIIKRHDTKNQRSYERSEATTIITAIDQPEAVVETLYVLLCFTYW